MPTKIESDILLGIMKHARIDGDYIKDTSVQIMNKEENKIFSFEDIYSNNFPISKDLYEDWIIKNKEPISFLTFVENKNVQFFPIKDFESLVSADKNKWSVFYSLTRPGICKNESSALIQITAHCLAGPPNYGSLYLLEKKDSTWNVKYSYGIYNQ